MSLIKYFEEKAKNGLPDPNSHVYPWMRALANLEVVGMSLSKLHTSNGMHI